MVNTWATVADVLALTQVTVTDADLMRAQAQIDMHTARIYADILLITDRDQYWLKLAVAYQAAWLVAQPDAFQRLEITEAGGAANRTMFTDTALVLAPDARWALKRVSWLKSRSLHVRAADEYGAFGRDDNNLYGRYEPL
ncbi:hypothetical protein [Amycolatopsis sp. H20-H5]|uniref:hypothetical protein n=1 Tax=Amycolatopsis sp. H20-H5 TaxID=3046309 RepID=UPI002DB6C603|nr:hypothetical protein [Amycolatopsis sp. H20-H5]MEC3974741.1 hypothetical protein [Amycolatopsis sp. H20-H5]